MESNSRSPAPLELCLQSLHQPQGVVKIYQQKPSLKITLMFVIILPLKASVEPGAKFLSG